MIDQFKADLNPPGNECRLVSIRWGRGMLCYDAELVCQAGFLEVLDGEIRQVEGERVLRQRIPISEIFWVTIRAHFPGTSVSTGEILCSWRRTRRGLERDPSWIP